ncbi:hypothetical protein C922_04647 [Plasmodium inui San Antonio 1]|uniref:Uncharacterized protein n=1 Tax=Plasmodium inui San Antonio 1 TaxID=1237626 RepID=W7A021_9APIC|nr:hypothetical protein C922_04647 [Plasmodium inui San Antonio 1]EUD64915.1 hypothetical protein C922_04647 [Plasmodium inui San Antonio 1]
MADFYMEGSPQRILKKYQPSNEEDSLTVWIIILREKKKEKKRTRTKKHLWRHHLFPKPEL